jgi:hypothetical protein
MPGPVWHERTFLGMFGEAALEVAELNGSDKKKGGDMAGLLSCVAHLLNKTVASHKAPVDDAGGDWLSLWSEGQIAHLAEVMAETRIATVSSAPPDGGVAGRGSTARVRRTGHGHRADSAARATGRVPLPLQAAPAGSGRKPGPARALRLEVWLARTAVRAPS